MNNVVTRHGAESQQEKINMKVLMFVSNPFIYGPRVKSCYAPSYIEQGCLVLRTRELEDRWLLFSAGDSFGFGGMLYQYNVEAMVSNHNIYDYLYSWQRVYDNESPQIYMMYAK